MIAAWIKTNESGNNRYNVKAKGKAQGEQQKTKTSASLSF